jgi:hypothetical protein
MGSWSVILESKTVIFCGANSIGMIHFYLLIFSDQVDNVVVLFGSD